MPTPCKPHGKSDLQNWNFMLYMDSQQFTKDGTVMGLEYTTRLNQMDEMEIGDAFYECCEEGVVVKQS